MKLRLILNSGFSGPHAPFFLAQERGYFAAAGLEVEFVAGEGAAAMVPLIGHDGIEAGYGDMNAQIDLVARDPANAPICVFAMFNAPPFTIAMRADAALRGSADLAGRVISGHANDAALKVFPAFTDALGIAAGAVTIRPSSAGLGEQVRDLLLTGQVDGVFGFVNTIIAALAPLGIDPDRMLRFVNFIDVVPDLYSNTLMVSRPLVVREPETVRALVHGVNRGLVDTLADLDAGIAAVARAQPRIDRAVQRRRLLGTLRAEMAHRKPARIGIGDVDDDRLARAIALLARSCGLPRAPAIADARGLFRDAGLDVAFTPGRGAYTAAERLATEDFDAAYGDLNALIELAAANEHDLPVGVLMVHEHAPSTITVAAGGRIRVATDLAGGTLIGHRTDVALRMFRPFARSAGLPSDAVTIETREAAMAVLLVALLAGEVDGVFGYVTTHLAALRAIAPPVGMPTRLLRYRDVCPAFYGSALMVSPRLLRDQPDVVAGLMAACRRGIVAAAADPDAAIAAVLDRNQAGDRDIERERWLGTLHDDMGCAAGVRAGLGDIDRSRLDTSIRLLAETEGWRRVPSADRIFTQRFSSVR